MGSNAPASASICLISNLSSAMASEKVRIAGMLLALDRDSKIVLIHDGNNSACFVDVSVVWDVFITLADVHETKAITTIIGYVEEAEDPLFIPPLPMYTEPPEVDCDVIIRAILLVPSPDLDLVSWRDVVAEREAFLHEALV